VIGTRMTLEVIFKREIRDTVLSRRFIIYLILLIFPMIVNIWFSWMMYESPSILEQMTALFPEPLTEINPMICLMSFIDIITFPIALVAVLHSSDFIAGERERGMLTLLISKPLNRWEIIIGKLFAFMVIFLPLLILNFLVMVLSIIFIGIGIASANIILGYLIVILSYAMVYTSIAILFSVLSEKSSMASLGTIIFLILWMILDFITIYLPINIANFLNNISLSYHIDIVLGFISGGEAGLFVKGGIASNPTIGAFIYSLSVIWIILTIIPIIISILIFERKDIQNR
jgi:ABC-type transport system involved in multi-copper enzyme maturation permease subunit